MVPKVGAHQACVYNMALPTGLQLTGLKMAVWPKVGQSESPSRELMSKTSEFLWQCIKAHESLTERNRCAERSS